MRSLSVGQQVSLTAFYLRVSQAAAWERQDDEVSSVLFVPNASHQTSPPIILSNDKLIIANKP